jgi:hypothetical protein
MMQKRSPQNEFEQKIIELCEQFDIDDFVAVWRVGGEATLLANAHPTAAVGLIEYAAEIVRERLREQNGGS